MFKKKKKWYINNIEDKKNKGEQPELFCISSEKSKAKGDLYEVQHYRKKN